MGGDPTPQDRTLNSPYFIIYGYRGSDNPANDTMRFPSHVVPGNGVPTSSAEMLNPATDVTADVTTPVSTVLTQLVGCC